MTEKQLKKGCKLLLDAGYSNLTKMKKEAIKQMIDLAQNEAEMTAIAMIAARRN